MNTSHIIHPFIHLSIDGHLGYLALLVIMNNAAVNIFVQVFVWMYVLISLVKIPESEIAGSDGRSMVNCLRNCQAVFQSGCCILHCD